MIKRMGNGDHISTANIIKIMSRLAFDGWWCWASLGTTARDCDSADFCGLGYALSLRLWRLLVWASGISSSSAISLYYCACSSGVTVTSYSPSPFVKLRGILIHLQIKCRAIQINFPCHTNHRSLSCHCCLSRVIDEMKTSRAKWHAKLALIGN